MPLARSVTSASGLLTAPAGTKVAIAPHKSQSTLDPHKSQFTLKPQSLLTSCNRSSYVAIIPHTVLQVAITPRTGHRLCGTGTRTRRRPLASRQLIPRSFVAHPPALPPLHLQRLKRESHAEGGRKEGREGGREGENEGRDEYVYTYTYVYV